MTNLLLFLSSRAERFSDALQRQTRTDGRLLFVGVLLLYFSVLGVASCFMPYTSFWTRGYGVPANTPIFSDTGIITTGLDARRMGFDPLYGVPNDPWGRQMNYPRIWQYLVYLGITDHHRVAIGIGLALLFFLCVIRLMGKCNHVEGALYAMIVCSPAVMLAIERGNNDLVIFCHLTLCALLGGRFRISSYTLIFFGAVLKFYPIFALTTLFRERRAKALWIGGVISVLFVAYIGLTWADVIQVSRATPRPTMAGFGRLTIFDTVDVCLKFRHVDYSRALKLFSLLATLSALVGAVLLNRKPIGIQCLDASQLAAFRIGSGIFLGVFVIGNNWNYRLLVLLLTLPMLLQWLKSGAATSSLRTYSFLLIVGMLATVWEPWLLINAWGARYAIVPVREMINWGLFFGLACLLIGTAPGWMRQMLLLPADQPKHP